MKYIVQLSCLLYRESRNEYMCVCLRSICIKVFVSKSEMPRGSPREWDHYHKFPRQLHLSSHYPAHLPMSHHHQSLPKSISFWEAVFRRGGSEICSHCWKEIRLEYCGKKMSSRTELSVWTECWAVQGLPEIRLVPYSIMSCTSLTKKIPPF